MTNFSAMDTLSESWIIFKKDWKNVYMVALIAFGASFLGGLISGALTGMGLMLVGELISMIIGIMVAMGGIYLMLKIARGQQFELAEVKSLFDEPKRILTFFWGQIVVGVVVAVGFLLLIVPGIMWAIKYCLTPFILVDKQFSVSEAMKLSNESTAGNRMNLFVFWLLVIGMNVLGAIPFGLGLLVTLPMTYIAGTLVYTKLVK